MTIEFRDIGGRKINLARWNELQKDTTYRFFRAFENDRIEASCEWTGMQKNADAIPANHWKMYRLKVTDVVSTDGEGTPLDDQRKSEEPQLTRMFRTRQECIDGYEDLLVRFGGCEWLPWTTGEGGRQFVERGDKLVPLPPDVPDGTVRFFVCEAVKATRFSAGSGLRIAQS